jgi:hypothetical protein
MKYKVTSSVISTRLLSERERDGVLSSIGGALFASGYEPCHHGRDLLEYQKVTKRSSGIPLLWGPKVEYTRAVVRVTDLPIEFTPEGAAPVEVIVGHAFGISAWTPVRQDIEKMLAPFTKGIDELKAGAPQYFVGRTVYKKTTVECDHCGTSQAVTIPLQVTSMEGDIGHGPGGRMTVTCSNPECSKEFEVTWDSVAIQVQYVPEGDNAQA